jgi:hypothetical protein
MNSSMMLEAGIGDASGGDIDFLFLTPDTSSPTTSRQDLFGKFSP